MALYVGPGIGHGHRIGIEDFGCGFGVRSCEFDCYCDSESISYINLTLSTRPYLVMLYCDCETFGLSRNGADCVTGKS